MSPARRSPRGATKRTASRTSPHPARGRSVPHCPVVGLGGSAGGLEALREFFSNLGQRTGMAFVVVVHLSPTHESLLSEILGRISSFRVEQARDRTPVKPDHVYVIPPNREIRLERGLLRVSQRSAGADRFLAIDHLFRSLAEDCGNQAIGVVFSGSSSDGAQGLKAIKQAGGITFAQDEASAKYPEMPRLAAAAGAVDFVFPPATIAREIQRLGGHPHVLQPPPALETEPRSAAEAPEIGEILEVVRRTTGSDFSSYKQSTMRRRVYRRMALARMEDPKAYLALLEQDKAEVQGLHQDLLINVTSFFRDPEVFRFLQKKVMPGLFRKSRDQASSVRVWVPGCSTGEEVYSLALSVAEFLGARGRAAAPVQIFGTDLSEVAIEKARLGRYPASIATEVTPARLKRYFVRLEDGYQVSKPLRDLCVFAKHDLLRDPPFSKIDLISCRNVLIYFGSVLQKRALSLLHYALAPQGYLLLGSSEHVGGHADLFDVVDKKRKLFRKRAVPARVAFGPGRPDPLNPDRPLVERPVGAHSSELQHAADRLLMTRYVPASVVVDDALDILQFRGQVGRYLLHHTGTASLNLLKMAREGLGADLREAVQAAQKSRKPVRRSRVHLRSEAGLTEIAIDVVPFSLPRSRGSYYLVLFEAPPSRGESEPRPRRRTLAARSRKGRATAGLEQELAATKEYLQTIIEEQESTNEELMSANEEILSSNEELQSTNEELETAKEELQSSNEELSTVNEELQNRNAELSDLNADLAKLLGLIHIPIAILDADLKIRRVTPPAERLLNIVPTDIGRSLGDLRPNVDIPDLAGLVKEVVRTVSSKDVDVRDREGRWYRMSVRPHKGGGERIDGVMLTWTDIDGPRRESARATWDAAEAVILTVPGPAALLGERLQVVRSNDAWGTHLPGRAAEGPLAWGHADLVSELKTLARDGEPLEAEVQLDGRAIRVRARRLSGDRTAPLLVTVVG